MSLERLSLSFVTAGCSTLTLQASPARTRSEAGGQLDDPAMTKSTALVALFAMAEQALEMIVTHAADAAAATVASCTWAGQYTLEKSWEYAPKMPFSRLQQSHPSNLNIGRYLSQAPFQRPQRPSAIDLKTSSASATGFYPSALNNSLPRLTRPWPPGRASGSGPRPLAGRR